MSKQYKTILMVDFSNLFSRCFHVDWSSNPVDSCDRPALRSIIIQSLSGLASRFKPDLTVMAMDCKPYWRSDLYSHYKTGKACNYNPESFHCSKKDIADDLMKIMTNSAWIKVPKAEADDVIAICSMKAQAEEIIIVSSDGDFAQLDRMPNVKRWNPVKKAFTEKLGDPNKELLIKIACGDMNDCIPPVKKGTGPKTVLKMMNNGTFDEWLDSDHELRKCFIRNSQLIDFRYIPSDIESAIAKEFVNQVKSVKSECCMRALKEFISKTDLEADMFGTIAARLNGDL